MGKNNINILITVPNENWVHKTVACTLLKLLVDNKGYNLKIHFPTHRPYENNLHHCVIDFIDGDYHYWLNIDSDNPPTNNPLDLIELDKDIMGLPTPVWHFENKIGERPVYWNVYKYSKKDDAYKEWSVKNGLRKVDAIGTGCFIIARRVFENNNMRKAPFSRICYPDGRVERGNDISFCERARKQGFKIWAHYEYSCRHYKEIELSQVETGIMNMVNH